MPLITDNGNYILDLSYDIIENPAKLEKNLLSLAGVLDCGLFCGIADKIIFSMIGFPYIFNIGLGMPLVRGINLWPLPPAIIIKLFLKTTSFKSSFLINNPTTFFDLFTTGI